MPEKESDIVRNLVAAKDYKKALRIAKNFKFGISKSDSDAMRRGYECMINPTFYEQIGIDAKLSVETGIRTIERLYGQKNP